MKSQAQYRDAVEMVADLADYLAQPQVAVVSIVPEKCEEGVHALSIVASPDCATVHGTFRGHGR
jgi:hypothetical protein